jgi:hypothetical protein
MAKIRVSLGWFSLLVLVGLPVATAQETESGAAMSEDARQMHERLIALSQGEASLLDLRIEFADIRGMRSHQSFTVEEGRLESKEWTAAGAPMIHREGNVGEKRIAQLLQALIKKEYWRFQGTRFVPDAPTFLFRFYYRDVQYVDFGCDDAEIAESAERIAIRELFLQFAAGTDMSTIP